MITLLATLFVFGLLVTVHELGHFIAAKTSGMKVTEFAIGFGPGIYKKQVGETLYSLRAIPLGGYNKIAGMDPDEEYDPRNFNEQSLLKRLFVIVAGSSMNLLLPILIFFVLIATVGIQKPLDVPVFGQVLENRPAAEAGLQIGDKVLAIEGTKIESWVQMVDIIKERGNQPTELLVARNGQELTFTLVPEYDENNHRGVIGVTASFEHLQPGIWESLKLSFVQTYTIIGEMLKGLYQLIFGSQEADIAGPLGVAQMAGEVAQYGFIPLLNFAAFLSINLGLINLFPVPMLDGGHVVTLILEGVRGKPLSAEFMYRIQMVGLALLLTLLVFATFKDIARFDFF